MKNRFSPIKTIANLIYVAFAALTLTLLLSFIGCAKDQVLKPTYDSTPPSLRWVVQNQRDNSSQDFSGDATLTIHSLDSYRVELFAEDPEGIHKISWQQNGGYQCRSGSLVHTHGPYVSPVTTQTLQPDSQGYVLTSILLVGNVGIDCQPGYTLDGLGWVTITGTGENYFNGTTQAQLHFQIVP